MARILHVVSAPSAILRFRMPLLALQRDAGCVVEVACRDEPQDVARIREAEFTVHVVSVPRRPRPLATPRGVLQLRRLIRGGGFDVVHMHQSMGGFVGILAASLARHSNLLYSPGGFRAHDGMTPVIRQTVTLGERVLFSGLRGVFTVNREDAEYAVRGLGMRPDRVHFVGARGGCGIDTDRFRPPREGEAEEIRRRLNLPERGSGFVVGIVARVVWEKGFRELLEAAAAYVAPDGTPPLRLVVVGDGPAFDDVTRLAEKLGLSETALFLGTRTDVPEILRSLDVFVLPSHREGTSVALIEGMASGLPVVATAVRGTREILEDGVNGLMVPPRNPRALTDTLRRLAASPGLARILADRAVRDAREKHSSHVLLPRLATIYERLLADVVAG